MTLMLIRRRVRLAATLPTVLVLSACGSDGADDTTTTGNQAADGLSVVTAMYPLAFVAERVGGDDITLTNLAAPGVEPHDLELAPQQVGSIADAALVVYLDGFAPAIDEAVEQNASETALDVDTVITLMESTSDDGHGHGEEPDEHADEEGAEHSDEEADEHADEEEEGDEHAEDEGAIGPHFWLDPQLLGELATSVAERLGEVDADNAAAYAERAATLVDELDQLDSDFEAGLASCDIDTMVTAHAAFGYLAERYGLEQFSVAGLEPDAEPSAARIAEVQAEIETEGVTTVYFEPLTSSDVVDAIADDLDLDTAELDPIESVDPDSGDDYLAVMKRNLATLQGGQGCS